MQTTDPAVRLRGRALIAALAAIAAVAVAAPPPAAAGTYDVTACAAAAGKAGDWALETDKPQLFAAYSTCAASSGERAFVLRNVVQGGAVASNGDYVRARFDVPAGLSIARLTAALRGYRADWVDGSHARRSGWSIGLAADGALFRGCPHDQQGDCTSAFDYLLAPATTSIAAPYVAHSYNVPTGTRSLAFQAVCGYLSGCDLGPSASGENAYRQVELLLESATVTIRDDAAPALNAGRGALWTSSGWQHGTQGIGWDAHDPSGVAANAVVVDPGSAQRVPVYVQRSCDRTRVAQCPDGGIDAHLDTASLPDGTHTLRIQSADAAGNIATAERTIATDNHAPGRPAEVTVAGGEAWRATNGFAVGWTNPAWQVAPIAAATYQLCPAAGGACAAPVTVLGGDIHELTGIQAPAPGDWRLRVFLTDAAGNADPSATSDAVTLRYDPTVPGAAAPVQPAGWLGVARLAAGPEHVAMATGAATGPSGIAGYRYTLDGSDPDATSAFAAGPEAAIGIADLAEGATTLRVRAVSGAGVLAAEIGAATLRVDRHAPAAGIIGAPDPSAWQRAPLTLALVGADRDGLSGMAAGNDGVPGGELAYRLDGGDLRHVAGDHAQVSFGDDGRHIVTLYAVDAAGNVSAPATAAFAIDRSGPERIAFEPQDPNDPRALAAAVADGVSGVAGGRIELRRAGTPAWSALPTRLDGDHLRAQLDDALASGSYELRAVARDRAGNEAVGGTRKDGYPAVVALPVRLQTELALVGSDRAGAARSGALRLRFGQAASLRAVLRSRDGRRGVAGAHVDLLERIGGAAWRRVARLRSDGRGGIRARIAAGPSRMIALSFAGTSLLGASRAQSSIVVPAAAAIAVDRRAVSAGETIALHGFVRGGHLPARGKLVELQAFFRGRWRTFQTLTTARSGAWRFAYRFGPAAGGFTYPFRVRVPAEQGYPFAPGSSPVVKVAVRP